MKLKFVLLFSLLFRLQMTAQVIASDSTINNESVTENDSIIVGVERYSTETTIERTISTKTNSKKSSNNKSYSSSSVDIVKVTGDSVNRKFEHEDLVDEVGPRIEVITPIINRGVKILEVNKLITVMGKVEDDNKVTQVVVNDYPAKVTTDGEFWVTIPLDYGENTVKIEAFDDLGNGSLKSFVVDRKMAVEAPTSMIGAKNNVNWQSPKEIGQNTSEELFNVQACIETPDTIIRVNLLVNGWKIIGFNPEDLESVGQCAYHISKQVTLQLDANRIRIEVVTNKTTFDDEIEVVYSNILPNYYALLIGNEEYVDPAFGKLGEPVSDAYKFKNVLVNSYNFKEQNITVIKNATRSDILNAFAAMRQKSTENDNVLIFFAGHGRWVEEMQMGFWIPVDAENDNETNWLSNSDVSTQIKALKSKHTLLISDACFSGSILNTRSGFSDNIGVAKLYDLPSRNAMTSGNKTEVPDLSVFMKFLIKRLEDNTSKYLTAGELYMSLKIAVTGNSPAVPMFGPMQNTGDEGGDFVFVKDR